ncbi:MAG: hypothetical protein D6718_11245 [Acidobacteria bacterium]|nr:MAG: hypothetical protein D6718_11245 [Acidobacteriota bacterium]
MLAPMRVSPQEGSGGRLWPYVAATVVVAGLAAVWLARDPILSRLSRPYVERARAEWEKERAAAAPEEEVAAPGGAGELPGADVWERVTGAPPAWPGDLLAPPDCADREEIDRALCRAVESVGTRHGVSCGFLVEAAETLAASPPELSRERASAEGLAENATHLFRRLRRRRLEPIRALLDEDPAAAEPLALLAFRRLQAREHCGPRGAETGRAAYAYASFALESLGGQAYLHRRWPRVAALASFYAILIVDEAERQGRNSEGVDLRPHIARTRALLERLPLTFRDRYLETLDRLASRWPGGS